MKVSEVITKLQTILKEEGDLPITCLWTECDEDDNIVIVIRVSC